MSDSATPWIEARQASLSFTIFQSLFKFMSIELVMPSKHLILCCPLLLASVFPRIRVFSNDLGLRISSVQFSSVAQSCQTFYDPRNHSTPGLPVHHQLPEFTQTHVHRVSDAIQPFILCCPLLLLPSVFPRIRVFSNDLGLRIRWPKN